jgi:hypothetical protein
MKKLDYIVDPLYLLHSDRSLAIYVYLAVLIMTEDRRSYKVIFVQAWSVTTITYFTLSCHNLGLMHLAWYQRFVFRHR